jgi:hypothetical protein
MEFAFDARTEDLRESLFDFMSSHVYPAEPVFHAQLGRSRTSGLGLGTGDRAAPRRGARPRPVKPLPAGYAWRRAYQPAVRPARRDQRPQRASGACRTQLRRPDTGEHGGALALRQRAAAQGVARALAGAPGPVVVRDDRARRGLLRRHQHSRPHRARRRRVCRQWPQVVDHRRDEPQREGLHRDGQERPVRSPAPPAVDDAGPARHARARDPSWHGGPGL